ncbi:MAG: nuclease-related domain-containing protein [Clostridia bacterium]|nr:nuclease-related domain-containing protein [Clostridia bacterium]
MTKLILIIFLIFLLFLLLILISIFADYKNKKFTNYIDEQHIAGIIGEEKAEKLIKSILSKNDLLFTNVEISFDGRLTELDNVIVNQNGVFIIEIKNYIGKIVGNEEDYEWLKYKTTQAGNTYKKAVRNPIKQVKRQIYLLANYLDYYGVKVWVRGYAYMIHKNSPIKSENILQNIEELNREIHTNRKIKLNKNKINEIKKILS